MQLTAGLALAAGLFVLGVLEAVFGFRDGGVGRPLSGPLAAEVLVVAGLTWPLAWWRRPLWALAVVAAALASQAVFLSPSAPFVVGLVPLLLLTFNAARQAGWRAVAGLGISAAAVAVTSAPCRPCRRGGTDWWACGARGRLWRHAAGGPGHSRRLPG